MIIIYFFRIILRCSKAFDSINHNILLNKLKAYGIRGIALEWFTSYLNDKYQYIQLNGKHLTLKSIKSEIPQGSILGPFLFIIYVNDLPLIKFEVICIFYADDTTILISDNYFENLNNKASTLLSSFSSWFSANKRALNDSKTNFVIFTHHRSQVVLNDKLQFDGHSVTRADFVSYLGYLIDSK